MNLVKISQNEQLIEARLDDLSRRMRGASSPALQLLIALGTTTEGLIDKLPPRTRTHLEAATLKALEAAYGLAAHSRGAVADTNDWLTRALSVGTGAAGGFGGVPTTLAELPVTATILLRAIQGIASEYGIDPESPEGKAACLKVFAAAGPLTGDDGTDLSFITLRLTITGGTLHGVISRIAPRLATAFGQKLAAQTVPVLGATMGAAVNYVFTSYYQDMARVQFGLMRLSRETNIPIEQLIANMQDRL